MYRISDNSYSVVARPSRRAPAGMFAISLKANQGLAWSDAPVFFDTPNEAINFLNSYIENGGLRDSAFGLEDRMYSMIHEARLSRKDLDSGFIDVQIP